MSGEATLATREDRCRHDAKKKLAGGPKPLSGGPVPVQDFLRTFIIPWDKRPTVSSLEFCRSQNGLLGRFGYKTVRTRLIAQPLEPSTTMLGGYRMFR